MVCMKGNGIDKMNMAFLLLGSNLDDRKKNLVSAAERIGLTCGKIVRNSGIYQTAPWGKQDQPDFYNQAIEIATGLSARQLLKSILEIEASLGRRRAEKYGPRIIDIDILLFNDEIIDRPSLKIPHPELQNRRFALEPLAEISPSLVHPLLKKTIHRLLLECSDPLAVKKLKD